ncbi:DUF2927 domain-containing protein [Pelagibius sp. Alg239-R121]|uniref:DUF2927 domain-containing protein n=1 Tax=Pelagibius sp. Alg239-R121 TaxID=2993448 RepID=UPI0024A680DE|nr:DUF2927 domain-containing protein [Pelagibius sp. Alg239-R121]
MSISIGRFALAARVALLSLLVASCAGSRYVAIPPTLVPDPIRLSDPRLIQEPPAETLAQFTVDAEGYIVDGPRSRPGEPVDHTALMTNAHIAESFAKVALTGGEDFEVDYAYPNGDEREGSRIGRLWKYEQNIGQTIFYRGGTITGKLYLTLDQAAKQIAENTRLEIPMLPRHGMRDSLAYIFVNGLADMQALADDMRELAKEHPPKTRGRYFYFNLATLFDTIVREDLESCLAFTTFKADDVRGSTLVVFFLNIPSLTLESCVYEETIQSMGLFNDDDTLFNTMFTDSFKEYLFPTELDWMMLRILYDPRIENGMTRKQAMPIVRQILKETRPHGEQPAAQPLAQLNRSVSGFWRTRQDSNL